MREKAAGVMMAVEVEGVDDDGGGFTDSLAGEAEGAAIAAEGELRLEEAGGEAETGPSSSSHADVEHSLFKVR